MIRVKMMTSETRAARDLPRDFMFYAIGALCVVAAGAILGPLLVWLLILGVLAGAAWLLCRGVSRARRAIARRRAERQQRREAFAAYVAEECAGNQTLEETDPQLVKILKRAAVVGVSHA
jgi:hypothetical protein